jgi:hypothetical protein
MHDIKGRLIEVGDVVKVPNVYLGGAPRPVIGHVSSCSPGAETCNGMICVPQFGGTMFYTFTATESELLLKANGSEPGPAAETKVEG